MAAGKNDDANFSIVLRSDRYDHISAWRVEIDHDGIVHNRKR